MQMIRRRPDAVARIRGGGEYASVAGTVRFYRLPGGVLVEADITGLPKNTTGFYGFHIHEGGDCAGLDFSDTGGHLGGKIAPHPRHMGDLPPLLSGNGKAYLAVISDRFSLADILGRTVVIHSTFDDFKTQPAGNAGRKIACGIILRPGKM